MMKEMHCLYLRKNWLPGDAGSEHEYNSGQGFAVFYRRSASFGSRGVFGYDGFDEFP